MPTSFLFSCSMGELIRFHHLLTFLPFPAIFCVTYSFQNNLTFHVIVKVIYKISDRNKGMCHKSFLTCLEYCLSCDSCSSEKAFPQPFKSGDIVNRQLYSRRSQHLYGLGYRYYPVVQLRISILSCTLNQGVQDSIKCPTRTS